jgi:hypothetical protein
MQTYKYVESTARLFKFPVLVGVVGGATKLAPCPEPA